MIKISNLSKTIDGIDILKDINLELEEGKIYAFVGRNGSGKSMFFKTLCGWISNNNNAIEYKKKYKFGVLIEKPCFMDDLSGLENIYCIDKSSKKYENNIKKLFEKFFLLDYINTYVGKYSLGMRQKLGIIQAIYNNPDVIILDEAFNGLDSATVNVLREELLKLKKQNKIILISSHLKKDISILADQVIYLKNGSIEKIEKNTPLPFYNNANMTTGEKSNNKYFLNNLAPIFTLIIVISLFVYTIFYVITCNKNIKLASNAMQEKNYLSAYEFAKKIPYTRFTPIKEKINYYNYFLTLINYADNSKNNVNKENKLLSLYLGLNNIKNEKASTKEEWKKEVLLEIEEIYYSFAQKEFLLTSDQVTKYFKNGEQLSYEEIRNEIISK